MRILHTSDLHIGKKLMGRDRYAEYRAILCELADICRDERVDLTLIAGDVFDTYTPSAESEEIFYSGVKEIARHCAVLIISGNHDDYVRLTAAAALASEINVYILGNNLKAVGSAEGFPTRPVSSGSGWVVFENAVGERVHINALPYPNEARFKEGSSDESFAEKMSRWISAGEEGKKDGVPDIFLSHIFVAGGTVGDCEREIDLGGTRAVPLSLLPDCDYCALGHLHRRQKLGKNVYYCGAPTRFSFDECGAEKSVNLFDIGADGVKNFKQVEIKSAKKLVKLRANGVESGVELLKKYSDAYAELTLSLDAPITPQESAYLRSNENLISLKMDVESAEKDPERVSNKNKSSSELFCDYYKSRYGQSAPEELLTLFLSLTETE